MSMVDIGASTAVMIARWRVAESGVVIVPFLRVSLPDFLSISTSVSSGSKFQDRLPRTPLLWMSWSTQRLRRSSVPAYSLICETAMKEKGPARRPALILDPLQVPDRLQPVLHV
jgi:hypothetical protein